MHIESHFHAYTSKSNHIPKGAVRAGLDCCRHHPFLASWWPLSIHSGNINLTRHWDISYTPSSFLESLVPNTVAIWVCLEKDLLRIQRCNMVEQWQWHDIWRLVWHVWHVKMCCFRVPILEPGYVLLFIPHFLLTDLTGNCACNGTSIISIDDMKWKPHTSCSQPTVLYGQGCITSCRCQSLLRWTACCDALKKIANGSNGSQGEDCQTVIA